MDRQRSPVFCPENEDLAEFMWQKRLEMAATPKGISDKVDMTLYKAYLNVCNSKVSITSMKDLSQIKGVGKWILKQVQDFFKSGSDGSEPEELAGKGKKTKGTRRYVPQKNSVAYALLITLYRGTTNGNEYMRKQELIDAAEASGLSRVAIAPEKGKGKPSQFGSSSRDWYSGWSCMKTLISRGLVVKSNCPAKYMLTEEGQQVARECLMRSGLLSSSKNFDNTKGSSILESCDISNHSANYLDSDVEVTSPSVSQSTKHKSIDVPLESLERFMRMGYSKHQVINSFKEVSKDNPNKDISSLWPAVLCRLREDLVYGQVEAIGRENRSMGSSLEGSEPKNVVNVNGERSFSSRACSSSNPSIIESRRDSVKGNTNILSMPPLSFGEKFEDCYNVVLILDDREQFAKHSSRSRRMIENICSQFKIQIEIRRLPVGDGIWIARHKHLDNEYVLDFIVERKDVDDLRCSIRDNRYRDQKLKLLRCGLKRMIYLVEGDPNSSEAAESIKTACFTTEILEGFDVQRTSGLSDTLKKYGYLTHAITQYYILQASDDRVSHSDVCPRLDQFIKKCQELDKMTVSDVFALQLMQVPQVTEEVAVAVLDLYPTLLSLVRAYSLLDGNVTEQEEMLRRRSNNLINAGTSMAGMFNGEGSSSVTSSPLQFFPWSLSPGIGSPYPFLRELKSEERGLCLIHLLLGCANQVAIGNIENANVGLEQISHLASPDGDTMQRIAAYFTEALADRILKSWPGLHRALNSTKILSVPEEILAQRLFFELCPFLKLAYVMTNQAIIEAMEGERMIHIIDFKSCEPAQWINLLQTLKDRPDGPPHLRITGIHEQKEVLEQMALRLTEEAEKWDIPFQFTPVVSKLENLDLESLRVKTGEALAVSSVLELHSVLATDDDKKTSPPASKNLQKLLRMKQRTLGEWLETDSLQVFSSPDSASVSSPSGLNPSQKMNSFLTALWGLSPKVMVITEQESNLNGSAFMERVLEALNFYAALFDCLESTVSRSSIERQRVEKMLLGEEIKNIIACEGAERTERHEKLEKWMLRLESVGFGKVPLSYHSMLLGSRLLQSYGYDGYKIKEENGFLFICWQDRPLFSVSAWGFQRQSS